jgi:hypothetical protein
MSRLLIDEAPLQVLPSLAKAIGLNEAIVLQQVHYVAGRSKDAGWVRVPSNWRDPSTRARRASSYAWWHAEHFDFWSFSTVERAFAELRRRELIQTENVPTSEGRLMRVRVNHDALDRLDPEGSRQFDGTPPVKVTEPVSADCGDALTKGTAETDEETVVSSSKATIDELPRPDVTGLCRLLAERILANDSKAKVDPDSKRWRAACRLLIDTDERTVEDIRRVIEWCQTDLFWRSNILSMPKLREKFPSLYLRAQPWIDGDQDDEGGVPAQPRPPRSPGGGGHLVDDRIQRLRDQAARERGVIDGSVG